MITLNILQYIFPTDTVWHFNSSEVVGYSISKNLHFVIDDGMCSSEEDDYYLLSIYKPTNEQHYVDWLPNKERDYSLKYPDDEKILEERVDFDNVYERVMWKRKIVNL